MANLSSDRAMAPGWLLSLNIAHGAYKGAPMSDTTLGYESEEPVDGDGHQENIDVFSDLVAGILAENSFVDSFYLRQAPHTPTETGIRRGEFRGGKLRLQGQRVPTGGAVALPPTQTLIVPKSVRKGKSGWMELRGCVLSSDVEHDASGSLVLKRTQTGGTGPFQIPLIFRQFAIDLMANWPHGTLVMMDKPLNIFDSSREIFGFGTPYLSERQLRNKRTSIEEAQEEALKREARSIVREITTAVSHVGDIFSDPTWASRLAQLGVKFGQVLAQLPLEEAAALTAEEAGKKLLALNQAT